MRERNVVVDQYLAGELDVLFELEVGVFVLENDEEDATHIKLIWLDESFNGNKLYAMTTSEKIFANRSVVGIFQLPQPIFFSDKTFYFNCQYRICEFGFPKFI